MLRAIPTSVCCCLIVLVTGCVVTGEKSGYDPLPDRPVVLIVGDSISMQGGYLPVVVEGLGADFEVRHNPNNGGDSANILAHFDEWILGSAPDIVHFNCGLHDIKLDRTTGKHQQSFEDYERNLREIVRRLKTETRARVVFALTTPVDDALHHANKPFDRRIVDVQRCNEIARRVMAENRVPVNDLYKVIMDADPKTCLVRDGVHMNQRGSALLGHQVCNTIRELAKR